MDVFEGIAALLCVIYVIWDTRYHQPEIDRQHKIKSDREIEKTLQEWDKES